jgi:RNA polymerase sigma factor (sigma-70 family)
LFGKLAYQFPLMLKKLFHKEKQDLSDSQLIAKYIDSKDNKFAGDLYMRYTHMVFGVCMKYLKNEHDSEDAVIQIFEKILVDLKRFEVDNFGGWLHQVTRNFCLMKLRKDKTKFKRSDEYANSVKSNVEYDDPSHLLDEESEEEVRLANLQEALSSLKEEQRVCVDMFFFKEKSYTEITEQTGFTLKQVKSYLQNGKRNLKNKLMVVIILLLFI